MEKDENQGEEKQVMLMLMIEVVAEVEAVEAIITREDVEALKAGVETLKEVALEVTEATHATTTNHEEAPADTTKDKNETIRVADTTVQKIEKQTKRLKLQLIKMGRPK